MNGFSDLFSANFSAMEAEYREFCDIVGCGLLSFDDHGSSARFTQSDLFSADFSVKQVENRDLCDSLRFGLLLFDGYGSSAASTQAGLFSATFPDKKAENEGFFDIRECEVLSFDKHGCSASSAQADCMIDSKSYPFNLGIAEGNDKGMDKRSNGCETERVRRHRMKSCFSEFASLLPSQRNNTKRKTSKIDIVSEGIKYICYLKKKMDGLSKKRDEIKIIVNDYQTKNNSYSSCKEGNEFPIVNIDHVCSHVLITINTLSEHMVLSKILVAIEEQDLQLINVSSFALHGKVTHTIHCKVSHINILYDNIKLGQKIWQMIKEKENPLATDGVK